MARGRARVLGACGPFHVALRRAARERGLTLERLRAHLGRRGLRVGLSSLSDWQTGRSLPRRPDLEGIVAALEEILDLEPGALARLLAGADPGRRIADVGVVAELLDGITRTADDSCFVDDGWNDRVSSLRIKRAY